jgi:D-amino-acid dehydrogenase
MRVVVMGAGVIGVTTAYELARDGHEVVVVDRQDKAAMETSFSNAGMASPGHAYTWASPRAPKILWQSLFRDDVALRLRLRPDPRMWAWCWRFLKECSAERAAINTAHKVRLCLYSLERFSELAREVPIDYHRTMKGAIYIYRDRDHYERGVGATGVLTDNGVTLRAVSTDEAVQIEPALAPDRANIAGAIYCPIDESGDCHAFTNRLAEYCATQLGVQFQWSNEIRRIEAEGDRVTGVVTDKGRLTADAYVLAAGSYSPLLSRPIGINMPIYPVKGYALTVPIEGHPGAPTLPGVDEKYLIAWSRLGDRMRVTAMADFSGFDRSHSERDFAHMLSTIRGLFPDAASYDRATRWAGLRPMTPKGTPILGASPKRNLFLNSGQGHIGWTMSMGSARVVADVVSGKKPAIDLAGLTLAAA